MAVSALDEEAGLVRLLHVLSPLPPAVAAARLAGRHAPVPKAESLSSVAGSTFAREKNWGLVEDGGELLLFYTLLPCTVVLAHDLSLGNATAVAATARTESRACFGGAAAAIARHTGARRGATWAGVAQTHGGPGALLQYCSAETERCLFTTFYSARDAQRSTAFIVRAGYPGGLCAASTTTSS